MSNTDLIAANDVGPWTPGVTPICPKAQTAPDLCDCGFLGVWEHRWVCVGNVIAGWDERCPGCGDIERFDMDANRVADFAEHAKVIVFMDAHR
jgi:hypothetical protein